VKKSINSEHAMNLAINKARETMNQNIGGPFGAAILDPEDNIIVVTSNSVLFDHDATAHAEINAIRQAGKIIGTHDLSGYTLVTSCYPCPMCLGAIIWSNIKHVIYGCSAKDAEKIGFRDDMIYDLIRRKKILDKDLILQKGYRNECLKLFNEYEEKEKEIY
jgi:guanine deaminase